MGPETLSPQRRSPNQAISYEYTPLICTPDPPRVVSLRLGLITHLRTERRAAISPKYVIGVRTDERGGGEKTLCSPAVGHQKVERVALNWNFTSSKLILDLNYYLTTCDPRYSSNSWLLRAM
jgi:hypothetical protein